MLDLSTDPRRVEVWVAMADHFLDTETRHDIPLTAMRCIDAGLTVTEARSVWCYEVSPAVGFNVWDVAGEWAGWNREWLVERIERLRRRWDNRKGTARWVRYRLRVHLMHGVWSAIGRFMAVLLDVCDPVEREQTSVACASLARHYFDFCPEDYGGLGRDDVARRRALYPQPFRHAVNPALVPGESILAHMRVQAALARARS